MTPTTRPSRRLVATTAAIALGAATLLGACGDDGDDSASTGTTEAAETTTEAAETPAGDELEITGAWARTSPAVVTAGAVYMEIANPTDVDDSLIGASVDATVAAKAELHETAVAEGGGSDGSMGEGSDDSMATTTTAMDGSSDTTGGGMMTMSPVDQIEVPAGGTAVLEPGGFHIMLLDLVEPLAVGTTIELTLTFEQAGEVVLTVDVLDTAP